VSQLILHFFFALPAMRNTLPGSPPVGNVFDTASFFWSMLLVATSVILLLLNYVVTTKVEKPKTVEKEIDANNLSASIVV
jgi:hypothetical protein